MVRRLRRTDSNRWLRSYLNTWKELDIYYFCTMVHSGLQNGGRGGSPMLTQFGEDGFLLNRNIRFLQNHGGLMCTPLPLGKPLRWILQMFFYQVLIGGFLNFTLRVTPIMRFCLPSWKMPINAVTSKFVSTFYSDKQGSKIAEVRGSADPRL